MPTRCLTRTNPTQQQQQITSRISQKSSNAYTGSPPLQMAAVHWRVQPQQGQRQQRQRQQQLEPVAAPAPPPVALVTPALVTQVTPPLCWVTSMARGRRGSGCASGGSSPNLRCACCTLPPLDSLPSPFRLIPFLPFSFPPPKTLPSGTSTLSRAPLTCCLALAQPLPLLLLYIWSPVAPLLLLLLFVLTTQHFLHFVR